MIIADACANWKENILARHLVHDSGVLEALESAFSYPTPTYFEDFSVMVSTLANLVVLGKFTGFIPPSLVNRFWSLLESLAHTEACAALAICYHSSRLAEMNLISVCDTLESIQTNTAAHRSKYLAIDGIWQGVQGYFHTPVTNHISEECIMNLKFPSIVYGQVMETGQFPFEMIGTGIDSFGEFELEDPMIDNSTLAVTFTKVYRQTNWSQSPIKHVYAGVMYPSGIGGSFALPPNENEHFEIGFFFYGRPLACANAMAAFSPSLPSMSHTATVTWDDLLPSIAKRAEMNAKHRSALLERFHLDPNTTEPIYEVPMSDVGTSLVLNMRSANRTLFRARIPSTSLIEMKSFLVDSQSIQPEGSDILIERYRSDNDTKWSVRCQMIQVSNSLYSSAYADILISNMDTLEQLSAILKQFNFDVKNKDVVDALHLISAITQSATPIHQLSPRGISEMIDGLRTGYELYRQAMQQDNSASGVVPESVSNLLSDTVRRREGEDGGYRSKRRGGTSTTLIVSAVAASALVLVGAFFVGRLFTRKSHN